MKHVWAVLVAALSLLPTTALGQSFTVTTKKGPSAGNGGCCADNFIFFYPTIETVNVNAVAAQVLEVSPQAPFVPTLGGFGGYGAGAGGYGGASSFFPTAASPYSTGNNPCCAPCAYAQNCTTYTAPYPIAAPATFIPVPYAPSCGYVATQAPSYTVCQPAASPCVPPQPVNLPPPPPPTLLTVSQAGPPYNFSNCPPVVAFPPPQAVQAPCPPCLPPPTLPCPCAPAVSAQPSHPTAFPFPPR